ncbi:hypothetical protein BD626DRAFT_405360 [Schizophyllum amplum]|uniref:Mog1p/PsbP-like protein n=1 Tax=Schizophyllum amplum TaxID=97359 RepID=A0A550CAC8_9AGAR|nr:hypothetical protein BD626DRAFT_405360 [Auriculariopsis ampla]
MTSAVRDLFGGAITARAPTTLIDASDLRQVPDTQEVFLYPDSSASIIVEVLQRVERTYFDDAIRFHFNSLAHDNDAQASTVTNVSVIPNDRAGDQTPSTIILSGVQSVAKFNRATLDEVRVLMALYRVESKGIDLVVTFNVPTSTSEDSGAVKSEQWMVIESDFKTFVTSLQIVDFGLFA